MSKTAISNAGVISMPSAHLISLTQAVIVAVVQLPLDVPVLPLQRGSLASSQARIAHSDL